MVGLLVSSFSLAQLLCAPAWGRMSDRLGRRPAILVGLGITAVSYVVFAFANSLWLLFVSRFVQGIGGGTIGVVQAYVVDASEPAQRTKSLGWLTAVTSLGAVAGPALGSALITLGLYLNLGDGRTLPGLAAAALAALTSVFAWKYLVESRGMRESSGTIPLPHKTATTGRGAVVHVLTRWHEPAPRLIWIYAIAIGAFYGTGPVLPLLFEQRFGITARAMGYIFAYIGGIGVIVRAGFLGKIVDRFGEARLSRAGIVVLAAGLTTTAFAYTWPMLIAGLTLMPLGTAFLFPCLGGILSRVVPREQRGLYFGVQQTFGGVTRVLFPIGAGILMDNVSRSTPFWIAGLLVMLTLPLALSITPEAKAA
jgi:MFS family permease